jgi:hypothetical protein
MSPTSPERLGPDLDTVVQKLREVLTAHSTAGLITEVVESEALLAFRANS